VATVFSLALGYAAASAHPSPFQPGARTGTVAGVVHFEGGSTSGVVTVSNLAGKSVAHRDVHSGNDHFRFVLKPGRYQVVLRFDDGFLKACPSAEKVRVRAKRTNHVKFAEACGSS
jgi:hypothetical protein